VSIRGKSSRAGAMPRALRAALGEENQRPVEIGPLEFPARSEAWAGPESCAEAARQVDGAAEAWPVRFWGVATVAVTCISVDARHVISSMPQLSLRTRRTRGDVFHSNSRGCGMGAADEGQAFAAEKGTEQVPSLRGLQGLQGAWTTQSGLAC